MLSVSCACVASHRWQRDMEAPKAISYQHVHSLDHCVADSDSASQCLGICESICQFMQKIGLLLIEACVRSCLCKDLELFCPLSLAVLFADCRCMVMWGDVVHHAGCCLPLWQARGRELEALSQDACHAASAPFPTLPACQTHVQAPCWSCRCNPSLAAALMSILIMCNRHSCCML